MRTMSHARVTKEGMRYANQFTKSVDDAVEIIWLEYLQVVLGTRSGQKGDPPYAVTPSQW